MTWTLEVQMSRSEENTNQLRLTTGSLSLELQSSLFPNQEGSRSGQGGDSTHPFQGTTLFLKTKNISKQVCLTCDEIYTSFNYRTVISKMHTVLPTISKSGHWPGLEPCIHKPEESQPSPKLLLHHLQNNSSERPLGYFF